MMFIFEIHSKSDCPWCEKAKAHLIEHGLIYKEYLYDAPDERQAMYDKLNLVHPHRTVPQIFLSQGNGFFREYIGGYNDLIRANLDERLQMENFDAEF